MCKLSPLLFLCVCVVIVESRFLYSSPNDTLSNSGFYLLPFATYSPETKLAIGVAGVYYFRLHDEDSVLRPSSINCGGLYSLKNQMGIGLYPDIYFDHDNVRWQGLYEYYRYPDSFYGVGSNTTELDRESFTPIGFKSNTSIYYNLARKTVRNGINLGLRIDVRYDKITSPSDKDSGLPGVLAQKSVTGSDGGFNIGVGPLFNIDTRDNVFASSMGYYVNIYALHYGALVGSDFHYNSYNTDSRYYTSLDEQTVIALQLLTSFNFGNPPFYSLARLGGVFQMRGIFDGKYRDNHSAILQSELRFPLFWRFRAALFTSIGSVSNDISGLSGALKVTYGGGFRFVLSEKEKLSVRFDVGFGDSTQFYVAIAEAF